MKQRRSVVERESHKDSSSAQRLPVLKTYKMYVDGKFPRSESERYYAVRGSKGEAIANICSGSRKDFRDALVSARKAQLSWASRSAYNKAQILYRVAEMLEGRSAQFTDELILLGQSPKEAKWELEQAVDRLVYYAGWADKFQQLFSSVNPVNAPYFNFSVLEPVGVVCAFAPPEFPLLGPVSAMAPLIAGGNTVVLVASEKKPLCAVTLGEVLQTSDLPAGVVNILTAKSLELTKTVATHMDLNGVWFAGSSASELRELEIGGAQNIRRIARHTGVDWSESSAQSPYMITEMQEVKTTWHPVGV